MTDDDIITNNGVFVAALVAFAVVGNYIERRWNPPPPWSNYRKDGGVPWVAFWNYLDGSVFTRKRSSTIAVA